ncbi:DUF5684 domain-containing protein [Microbacterium sp. 179-I 3D4 NHS]|uniref:DUF5684 domain-containing protein n=1 Tax=Microbacterium sp. 179-I 3D4 NHS TaxID=3142381 RepID=UPI0039A3049E
MTPSAEAGLLASLLITIGVTLVVGLAIYVWYAIALSRLFPRIGGEGWKGWVPILNEAEILARGGQPAWAAVLFLVPVANLYALYLKVRATHRINEQFARGAGSTVLAILLPPVWATILAAGPDPYPEGDRLAALQPPGPRRTPQPAFASETDADDDVFAGFAPQRSAADHAAARPQTGFIPIPPRGSAEPSAPTGLPESMPAEWQAFAPAPSAAPAAPPSAAPQPATSPFTAAPPAPPATPAAPSTAASLAAAPPAPAPAPTPVPPVAAPAPHADHGAVPTASVPPSAGPVTPAPFVDPLAETVRAVPPRTDPPTPILPATAAPTTAAAATPPLTVPPAAAAVPAPMPLDALESELAETVISPRRPPVIDDDDFDETVVVARKRGVRRSLVLDDGRTYALSGARVVIGRNPVGDPGEQRLAITDLTRTLSKTHARLVVTDDEWRLTDLHATNGVVVVADDGTETLLDPGESVVGTGRFILGEVGMYVTVERDS